MDSIQNFAIEINMYGLAGLQELSAKINKIAKDNELLAGTAKTASNAMKGLATSVQEVSFEAMTAGAEKAIGTLKLLGEVAGVALAAVGFESVKLAGDFEANMNRVKFTLQATDGQMAELQKSAIEIGKTTTFSSKEAAAAYTELAAKNYNANQIMELGLPIARAAMVNNIGMKEAAEGFTAVMHSFGMSVDDSNHTLDVMAKASQMAGLSLDDFQKISANTGTVAHNAGQSFEETTGAMVAMKNAGMSVDRASQALRFTLVALEKPNRQAADAMKDLGLNIYDAQGKMIPFSSIVQQVEDKTKGMTDAQKQHTLATIFGKNGLLAMGAAMQTQVTVMENGKEVTLHGAEALRYLDAQLQNADGTAKKATDTLMSGFNASLKNMKGSLEEAGISIGQSLTPGLTEMVKGITAGINHFIDFEQKTHAIGAAFKAVGDVIGAFFQPFAAAIGSVVEKFAQASEGTNTLRSTIELLVPVASLLGNAFVRSFEMVGTVVGAAVSVITSHMSDVTNVINTFKMVSEIAFNAFNTVVSYVAGFVSAHFTQISQIISGVGNVIGEAITIATNAFHNLEPALSAVAEGFMNLVSAGIDVVQTALDALSGPIDAVTQGVGNLAPILGPLAEGFGVAVLAMGAFELASGTCATAIGILGAAIDLATGPVGIIAAAIGAAILVFQNWDEISRVVGDALGNVLNGAINIAIDAVNGLIRAANFLIDAWNQIPWHDHVDKITELGHVANDTANKVNGLGNAGKTASGGISAVAGAAVSAIPPIERLGNAADTTSAKLRAMIQIASLGRNLLNMGGNDTSAIDAGINYAQSQVAEQGMASVGAGYYNSTQATKSGADASTYNAKGTAGNNGAAAGVPEIPGVSGPVGGGGGGGGGGGSKAKEEDPLKAALDLADKIGKAAEVMTKLEDFQQVSQSALDNFNKSMGDMVQGFVQQATRFNKDGLQAASDYAESAGKVADTISKMADGLMKLQNYSALSADKMAAFLNDMQKMVVAFVQGGQQFSIDAMKAAILFAETAGKVGDAVGKMANGLVALSKYSAISQTNMDLFVRDMRILTEAFANAGNEFTRDMLKHATAFADTASKVGDAIGKMANGLVALSKYTPISQTAIDLFVRDMRIMTEAFANAGNEFSDEMIKNAAKFADPVTKVGDAVGKAADGLGKVADYGGVARANIDRLVSDLKILVADFAAAGAQFTDEMNKQATSFADVGGKTAGAMNTALGLFEKLADYGGVARKNVDQLVSDMAGAVQSFVAAGDSIKALLSDASVKLADDTGKIFTGLKNALDVLSKLSDYSGATQAQLDAFFDNVRMALVEFNQKLSTFDTTVLGIEAKAADLFGKIFSGLKNAVDTLNGISKFKAIAQKDVDAFLDAMVGVLGSLASRLGSVSGPTVTAAEEFATQSDRVFSKLKTAVDVISGLEKIKGDIPKMIGTFLEGVKSAVIQTAAMANEASTILKNSEDFATRMGQAAQHMKDGAAAMNGLPSGVTGGGGGGSNNNAPAHAAGGQLRAGMGYKVGDGGPEYFVPNTDGYLVNNSMYRRMQSEASKGKGGITVQGDIVLSFPQLVGPLTSAQMQQFKSVAKQALQEMGGNLAGRVK